MTIEEWLNHEELPVTIWRKKYQQKGENFEQWLNRISAGDETVKELIREKKFIFAGRILSNRGIKDQKITLSNCYVVTPPNDNLESIFDAGAKWLAHSVMEVDAALMSAIFGPKALM